ncbi:MAG: MBL fold metallo-hydrolase [Thermomicrobiales bacterium]
MLELTFLGTGTSNGIPVIGCDCAVCTSNDPRDTRFRTSAVVRWDDTTILIDTSPELRLQSRAYGIDRIDAVLYTHAHADHTGGLDDLRRFNEINQAHLPVYASPVTAEMLRDRYAYAFTEHFPFYGGKPDLTLHEFEGSFDVNGKTVVPVPVMHGRLEVSGFRFGPLAYVTDAKTIPEDSLKILEGVEVLVLNALRERSHPTHLSLSEAARIAESLAPRQTWLVHLSHESSHEAASAGLPEGVAVAYDGLTVIVE